MLREDPWTLVTADRGAGGREHPRQVRQELGLDPRPGCSPLARAGRQPGQEPGRLGGSEEERVLPEAPFQNAGSQAPRSALRACFLFSPSSDTIID